MPAHMPSAPAVVPRPFETTKRSLTAGHDEQEWLNWEMRAGQALFTEYGGVMGMMWVVLMQPMQLSGVAKPLVP